ncbi:PREDICTED: protransforming growth factor alpha [Elephantulus edwardii]|uniref:protransforming growth factor alpha n=1 Tax=Elephantulus edwardii TaxID=28737 RepID=UPI0003F0F0D6|nr:PREDICTED: protransforming growth factor alpha [Elephantulus edwardii]
MPLLSPADPPVAAAVVSHFNDCPDSHSQFCFHGTCRFLVQEDKPACVCHSGYVGARCEHADLLAVVAASQKKQAITALVVVSVVALAGLIITCVLIHCCQVRKHCKWCRTLVCRHEKPSALLKGRTTCCHSETGTGVLGPGDYMLSGCTSGGLRNPEEEFSQVDCGHWRRQDFLRTAL